MSGFSAFRTAAALLLAVLGAASAQAQGDDDTQVFPTSIDRPSQAIPIYERALTPFEEETGVRTDRLLVTGAVTAVCLGSYLTYGALFWWDEEPGSFHWTEEGNMEEDSYAGGTDKLGHAWACYTLTRVFGGLLRWSGAEAWLSEVLAGATVQVLFLFTEIEDAFFDYGFSAWDFAFNLAGTLFAAALDLLPGLDEVLDFRVWYWPTSAFRDADWNPAEDYSGLRFFLVLRPGGLGCFRGTALSFLELHLGYFTRGYKPVRPRRERLWFVGVSLDLGRLVRQWLAPLLGLGPAVTDVTDFVLEYWQPYPVHAPLLQAELP